MAAVTCSRCGVPFHRDCWDFNGGCGIYGCCGTAPSAFEKPPPSALLAIDEATRQPWRLEPLVEGMVRSIPPWSRAWLPPVACGVAGGAAIYALAVGVIGKNSDPRALGILVASGLVSGLFAAGLGPVARRWPWPGLALLVGVSCLAASGMERWGPYHPSMGFDLLLTGLLTSLALASSIAAWGVDVACRAFVHLGRTVRAVLRAVAAGVAFLAFLNLLNRLVMPTHGIRDQDIVALLALLGVVVAAPPMELSTSALLHRLKAEASVIDDGDAAGPGAEGGGPGA